MAMMRSLLLFSSVCAWAVELDADVDVDATDDVSLLQVKLQVPLGNVPLESQKDIPEAPRAWALYQHVTEEMGVHELANATSAAPPGPKNGEVVPMAGDNKVDSYFSPRVDELTPSWVFHCLGAHYQPTAVSSWRVLKVTTPQLVPFIVPADHADRSDASVVIVPGGGGEYLAWESEGTDLAKALNVLGISAFVLKYRVPAPAMWSRHAHIQDSNRAVSLVKHFAPALGLNRSRVGLFGASHGGIVAVLSVLGAERQYPRRDVVESQSHKPDFLLLNYPELPLEAVQKKVMMPAAQAEEDDVVLGKIENLPPMYIANGADDQCCPVETLYMFLTSLKLAHVSQVEVNIYKGLGHGFTSCQRMDGGGLESMKAEGCLWIFRAKRFIMRNVEHKVPSDVETWYNRISPHQTSLISTNTSGL